MREPYYLADDCPNCGQKDSTDAYKGARMGSSAWGHDYACCSEACGVAFENSAKRWQLELHEVDREIKNLKDHRKYLLKKFKKNKSL